LPFENHSRHEAYLFVADAFSSELHSTLARVDRLRVASRRSSFAFKDAKTDVRDIARQLNVHYIISGSLQCDGQRLRVIAELDDGDQGMQLWARSYDREIEDIFSVEKEVAEAIVGSFATLQLRAEIHNARQRPTSSLDAWGLVQKARSFVMDYTAEGLTQAIAPLRRAVELDPDYPAAQATLGSLLVERLVNGLSRSPKQDEGAALDAARKALALAPQDPFILKMVSFVWAHSGDHRKAINCLRRAVAYAPFDFGAWGYMGWPMTASGEAQELRDLQGILDRLLKMEPHHPGAAFWLYHKAVADVCEGNYESARKSAEAAIELRPSWSLAWMHYANILGHQHLKDQG
jgi:adenylate cyclase